MVVTDAADSIVLEETPAPLVHVVDDDRSLNDSTRFLLESDGLVVRTYHSANEFLERFDGESPGCILLDLKMEHEHSGLDVLRALSDRGCRLPVIVISGHGGVRVAVSALQLGAVDFLEKPVEEHTILGRVHSSVERSVRVWPVHREIDRILARRATLTKRQQEVLDLVVAGLSSREIAERLGVTEKTIEAHRQSISSKMNAGNVSQLVRMIMAADPPDDAPFNQPG